MIKKKPKTKNFTTALFVLTVFFAPFLGHFAGNDLADVLDGELSSLDEVFRLHSPPASVFSPVYHQAGLKKRIQESFRGIMQIPAN